MNLCLLCRDTATSKCSRCGDAWYCSREHQREHWEVHKRETCLCARGKKMPADITAEAVFPYWIRKQFDSGRTFHQWRERNMQPFTPEPTRILSGINRPIPFQGNRRKALANLASHNWPDMPLIGDTVSTRCNACQAKFVHAAAYYPCGQSPPRTQN